MIFSALLKDSLSKYLIIFVSGVPNQLDHRSL